MACGDEYEYLILESSISLFPFNNNPMVTFSY